VANSIATHCTDDVYEARTVLQITILNSWVYIMTDDKIWRKESVHDAEQFSVVRRCGVV